MKKRANGKISSKELAAPTKARAAVIHPIQSIEKDRKRSAPACLEEAVGLAKAIYLNVMVAEAISQSRIRPSTFIGKGTLDRLSTLVDDEHLDLVIINTSLTPVQQRNLENTLKTKVIDRTGLILEIFGARAQTYEGRLQVELAALTYQRSRLVRSWTHLERQQGGRGFLGGPGERQIEMDRRIIGQRITKLTKELSEIGRTRNLHRLSRKRRLYSEITLVGYTNAGKSTLFNQMTQAGVKVKDMLFATLDPTARAISLPSGRRAILSDTVGFISELPTQLVEAFKATLEGIEQADLIVHVRDISHPESEAQKDDVIGILTSIGIDEDIPIIEVMNKIDLLDEDAKKRLIQKNLRKHNYTPISAKQNIGCDLLLNQLDLKLIRNEVLVNFVLEASDGEAVAWLYAHGNVIEQRNEGDLNQILVKLDPIEKKKFESRFKTNLKGEGINTKLLVQRI